MNVPYRARPTGQPEDLLARQCALALVRDFTATHLRDLEPDDLLVRRYLRQPGDDVRGHTHDLLLVLVPKRSSANLRDLILAYARGDLEPVEARDGG